MHEITRIQKQIAELQNQKHECIKRLKQVDTSQMSKYEVQQHAMSLPEIPDHLYNDMREYGFQTGSSVYSGVERPSDIDWVCQLPASAFLYANCAVACSTISAEYLDNDEKDFVPLYASRDGILYNIICIGDQAKYNAWKQATEILQKLNVSYPSIAQANLVKWKRVRVFRALCDVLEEVKPRASYKEAISLEDALKYSICRTCGREAVNFTDKAHRETYNITGICERCNP